MNRIILIGNGFDLAHGMKTSYSDFIEDYWSKACTQFIENGEWGYSDDNISVDSYNKEWKGEYTYENLRNMGHLQFRSQLLRNLTSKHVNSNWVDIENEYYSLLKKCYQYSIPYKDIKELNRHFLVIQNLLEKYLTDVEKKFIETFPENNNENNLKDSIFEVIYSDFKWKDFSEPYINKFIEKEVERTKSYVTALNQKRISLHTMDFTKERKLYEELIDQKDIKRKIRKLLLTDFEHYKFKPKETLFVNFNYTSTEKLYGGSPENTIHIHGELNNKDNTIIFGFGDEIGKDYAEIENLNNNDYLENIKSIKYLESDSYKQLLEFINLDDYQIFLFGHSCGISDRTLLNTLFENKNCCSIKPFFRLKNDGTDNYSDIVRSISRNFKDKVSMRDKVVNKQYTKALFK